MNITIFGKGNMGSAIGKNFTAAGNEVTYYTSKDTASSFGDIVVLAIPYAALDSIVQKYGDQLAGKIVVDITNPVNFDTWDSLVIPAGTSVAEDLQKKLPDSHVLKAFNTTFAATLDSGKVGDLTTTVLVAGNDDDSKKTFMDALADSPLDTIDAGALKRAREMEATGFLQMTLAARKQINWNGGFGIIK